MSALHDQFFNWVNNTYLFGITIDHFFHVGICFTLFLFFKVLFKFKTYWCFVFIFLIGLWKVWYSWGAMLSAGRFENPYQKMGDNFLGAFAAYLLWRALRSLPASR